VKLRAFALLTPNNTLNQAVGLTSCRLNAVIVSSAEREWPSDIRWDAQLPSGAVQQSDAGIRIPDAGEQRKDGVGVEPNEAGADS
jgi:hypothetical protein